jgi:hypothetical protein
MTPSRSARTGPGGAAAIQVHAADGRVDARVDQGRRGSEICAERGCDPRPVGVLVAPVGLDYQERCDAQTEIGNEREHARTKQADRGDARHDRPDDE